VKTGESIWKKYHEKLKEGAELQLGKICFIGFNRVLAGVKKIKVKAFHTRHERWSQI